MNHIVLMGRLTADPVLKTTQSGVQTCRFMIAVDRGYTNKTTKEREADFISCVAWRSTAEFICRYFRKGKMISIEGSLRSNNYQDRKHPDITHYSYDVVAEKAEFCGDKDRQNSQQQTQQQAPPPVDYYQPPPEQYYQQQRQNGYSQQQAPPPGYYDNPYRR